MLSIGRLSDELREQLGFGFVLCVLDLENLEMGFEEMLWCSIRGVVLGDRRTMGLRK